MANLRHLLTDYLDRTLDPNLREGQADPSDYDEGREAGERDVARKLRDLLAEAAPEFWRITHAQARHLDHLADIDPILTDGCLIVRVDTDGALLITSGGEPNAQQRVEPQPESEAT